MTKRFSIIASILCIALCCCMVVFGVYSASNVNASFASNVTFSPTNLRLRLKGIIDNAEADTVTQGASLNYYSCNYNEDDPTIDLDETTNQVTALNSWIFGNISFEPITVENPTIKSIVFYIQIKNIVQTDVVYSLKANWTDGLQITAQYRNINNELVSSSNTFFQDSEVAPLKTDIIETIKPAQSDTVIKNLIKNTNSQISATEQQTTLIMIKIDVAQEYLDIGLSNATFGFDIAMDRVSEKK